MFGPRRRRPVLGAALVVGASRASAKHEVERQVAAEAQRESDIDRAAEEKYRRKQEQDIRAQRAAEEALRTAGVSGSIGNASASAPPTVYLGTPQQTVLNPAIPRSVTPSYTVQNNGPNLQPANVLVSDMQNIQYCPACGNTCDIADRFCRKCGIKQARG